MTQKEPKTNPELPAFKPSKFTIQTKLMGIISFIIIVSITGVIALASYLFKRDFSLTIEAGELQITHILSTQMESDLLSLSQNLKLFLKDAKLGKCDENFFENDNNILFAGVFGKKESGTELLTGCTNPRILNKSFQSSSDFASAAQNHIAETALSFDGKTVLRNASLSFKSPVLMFAFPFQTKENRSEIVIMFAKHSLLGQSFQGNGMSETFLVDENGNTIYHEDSKNIESAKNLSEIPIVASVAESKVDTAQHTFQYKNEDFIGTFNKLNFTGGSVISMIQVKKILEPVNAMQRNIIFLMLAVLSLSLLIVFLFSRSITIPVKELVVGTQRIQTGDYSTYIIPSSGDEIGSLTNSFNSMSKGLDEREKMKKAFSKFVNEEIADLAAQGEIKLGGERKFCAIFFSDIRGFTSISEKLEPEEVVEFLNQYMTEMVTCVKKTGGIVDKFIGDAIMATWGALKHLPNETECAVNASIMMRTALLKFNVGRGGPKKPIINIGCGINSGYVISGQIGSDERLEYTVIGDSVNLASRIESLNKPFGSDILISSDSYEQVKDIFNVEKMPAIKVKGKEEPQTIYAVLGRKDDPNCPKSMREVRELIGMKFDEEAAAKSEKKEPKEEVKYEIL